MTLKTSAGSTLGVTAGLPATHDAAGFAALVYTPIGEVTNIGELGREYALVTHKPVGIRSTKKFKGSFNEGALALQLGLDNDDAGQILMEAAQLSDSDYSFKLTTSSGRLYYFRGLVMGWKVGVGSVDQITAANTTIEIQSKADGTAGIVLV